MLEVGTRIIIVDNQSQGSIKKGLRGIIIGISRSPIKYAVRFDEYVDGHNCAGLCRYGYGRYVYPENIKAIGTEQMVFVF